MRILPICSFVTLFIALTLAEMASRSSAFAQEIFLPKTVPIPLNRPPIADKQWKSLNTSLTVRNNLTSSEILLVRKLKLALDALSRKNIPLTLSLRDSMEEDSLGYHILTWVIGVSAHTNLLNAEMLRTINKLKGWPRITILQHNAERSFIHETHSPQAIIQTFAHHFPVTAQGVAAFAKALIETKQITRAQQILAPWWHKTKLSAKEEALILKNAGAVLKPIDHLKRMHIMLYTHQTDIAKRAAALIRAQSLFDAFIAVKNNDPRAEKKLRAAERLWKKEPLLQFSQIRYLRRTKQYRAAATLMLSIPRDVENFVKTDAWWRERRALSREMLDLNKPRLAYQLATTHIDIIPSEAADAEFHAGWYALRFLHDPQLAIFHFARIPQLSSTPSDVSRGYYWMGRAAETLKKPKEAASYFRHSAHFKTTYYAQLAASKLNQRKLEISFPKPTNAERTNFRTRKIVKAIRYLEAANYAHFAKPLYIELGKKIDSPGELALLAVMAEKNGDYHTSLKIGKLAAFRGKNVGALSHPIGAIPKSLKISEEKKALLYAIARQESEFNPEALSRSGAQGMLQLLPKTAKALAYKYSIAWSPKKLRSDAHYNAMLGAYFLKEQLERFDGSYVLALTSYNAGPQRVKKWIERYGDPRNQSLHEIIDWVERIPYAETRSYVMRVMENYGVYKARIIGTTDIKTDLMANRYNRLKYLLP